MKKYLLFLLAVSVLVSCAGVGAGAQNASKNSRYVIKNEKVHIIEANSEKILDDAEVSYGDGGKNIRCWSAFSDGDKAGIYFFDGEGKFVSSLPLDSENELQGLLFSPEGLNLAVIKGSGVRPDIEYVIYDAETMKEKVSFGGVRGEFFWLDPHRAAFTRIDDGVREGGSFYGLGYGLYLSAVMYDILMGETFVLNKSTETQNFSVSIVDMDALEIHITESSVKSKEDWGDENKITETSISVPVPAAG